MNVSVVILTCNRKKVLTDLLTDMRRQTVSPNFEIVVVDNHSTDGTDVLVQKKFPDVVYVRLPENVGCAGRNAGIQKATGDIVVTLDDDVFFHRADELARIIQFFETHPECDAVNFKVLFFDTKELVPFNWYHPRPYETSSADTFETDYISEGAVAFRKPVFEKAGYYPADYFISHEGIDLAFRIIDSGHAIFYSGDMEVLHQCSKKQRLSWRNSYYNTRNYFWLLVKYFPWPRLIPNFFYRMGTTFVFTLRRNQVHWYLKAVWDAFLGMPRQWKKRQPLKAQTWKRLKDIRRLKPNLSYKVRNFILRTHLINEKIG